MKSITYYICFLMLILYHICRLNPERIGGDFKQEIQVRK
jgi:hypothetical protein